MPLCRDRVAASGQPELPVERGGDVALAQSHGDVPVQPSVGLEDLARREFGRLVALGAALTGSVALVEELAQEALLAAVRHWPKIRHYDRPEAWLRPVVINAARSSGRRRRREDAWLAVQTAERRPDRVALDGPFEDELWATVLTLPRRQVEVIVLFYVLDHSLDVVAAELGITVGSSKTHLHRGLECLRALAPSWEERS